MFYFSAVKGVGNNLFTFEGNFRRQHTLRMYKNVESQIHFTSVKQNRFSRMTQFPKKTHLAYHIRIL